MEFIVADDMQQFCNSLARVVSLEKGTGIRSSLMIGVLLGNDTIDASRQLEHAINKALGNKGIMRMGLVGPCTNCTKRIY